MPTPSSTKCSSTRPTPPRTKLGWSSCCARSALGARLTAALTPSCARTAAGCSNAPEARSRSSPRGERRGSAGPSRRWRRSTRSRRTAQVMHDVGADVLAVVEADDRPALIKFEQILFKRIHAAPYAHVMLIDGNDDRGIDVALLTNDDYPIMRIRSHVDDRDDRGVIFSRDCPEYTVGTPAGERIVFLVNHLKSKGYGKPGESSARRERQRTALPRFMRGLSPTASRMSSCSATSTTFRTRLRSHRCSRRRIFATSARTATSTTPAGRARSATARRATRSTTSSSRLPSGPTSPAA